MNTFDLDSFFPKDKLQLAKVGQTKETIHIYLRSKTKSCVCLKCSQFTEEYHGTYVRHVQDLPVLEMNILAHQYLDSGKLSTDVPDMDTGIDWLVYLARYSQQCQACFAPQSGSGLDIVENTEIMAGPNQLFYCGTLRPDCCSFRTGIFKEEMLSS